MRKPETRDKGTQGLSLGLGRKIGTPTQGFSLGETGQAEVGHGPRTRLELEPETQGLSLGQ